jgi:hypothetical protein
MIQTYNRPRKATWQKIHSLEADPTYPRQFLGAKPDRRKSFWKPK